MTNIDYRPLDAYLRRWLRTQPYGWHLQGADAIATEFIQDVAFANIRLAAWLERPDVQVITKIVEGVLPYPERNAVAALTQAIMISARRRTANQVAAGLGIGVLVALAIYLFGQG